MKQLYILTVFCLFLGGGVFSANAQDIINLKDGKTIQAKVLEIGPTEIKYKRFDNQNGPTIIIYAATVVSIKYQNGVVDVINAAPMGATAGAATGTGQQIAEGYLTTQLQSLLNSMPAVTIAGNSLKFQFNGDKWTALLNGENFSTGVTEVENTANGSLVTLKQTHIWPGAAVKTAGKIAGRIPGGAAVGGAVNTASSVAGAAGVAPGAVESSGKAFVFEYVSGPSPKISFLKTTATSGGSDAGYVIPLETAGFMPNNDPKSNVEFNINTENLEGEEKEVLNINGTLVASKAAWAELYTDDKTIIEKLVNGSGIRFKVIGDGNSWYFQLLFEEINKDYAYYHATIKTKKNKIVQIDIPYSRLKQPTWGRRLKFDKNNIQVLKFGMGNDGFGGDVKYGKHAIKIFDIEIY